MNKKLSLLLLAGLVALPTYTLASDLEDRVAALEENSETWNKASRIQWSGDFRFRTDYMSADAPSHFTALNVASRASSNFSSAKETRASRIKVRASPRYTRLRRRRFLFCRLRFIADLIFAKVLPPTILSCYAARNFT